MSSTLVGNNKSPTTQEELVSAPAQGLVLRIAICGIRGVPACYGGFETFAEEIATRLVERGHQVRVYGRSHVIDYEQPFYRGIEVVRLPAPKHKYLETPIHTIRCFLHLLRKPVDVVLVCNAANSPFIWIPMAKGMPVAINLDGIERLRAKWNTLGKLWYRLGEYCATRFATKLISDAQVIFDYYKETYGRESAVIPYGYAPVREQEVERKLASGEVFATEVHQRFSISPGNYVLYVSRLEPENNALLVIQAYKRLRAKGFDTPLVVVGDAPYAKDYIERLHQEAAGEVIFTGFIFGDDYFDLQLGAKVYIQATEVGGTHPALVEAMGFANCVLANNTPENSETVGDAGILYKKNSLDDLSSQLGDICRDDSRLMELRKAGRQRAQEHYDWERITSSYESLLGKLARPREASEAC